MVLTYGQQARGYALMMFLAAVAALALLRIVGDGPRRRDWVAWTAAIALLPYAHLLGGLVVVALLASLVAAPRDRLDLPGLAGSSRSSAPGSSCRPSCSA